MGSQGIPTNYLDFNTQQTKNVSIVVKIAGISNLLTNRPINTRIKYGDVGLTYGSGAVYGGLRAYSIKNQDGSISTYLPYLSLEGSSTAISQRLEPEQGKASVSTINLAFVDYQGYMTKLVSPGVIIPEIMGTEVEVWLGYDEISYPEDYFMVFRGYVSSVDAGPGLVTLQVSDPNIKRRQTLFFTATTSLSGSIGTTDAILPVVSNSNFFNQITQPGNSASHSSSIHTYIQIDSEWIEAVPIAQGNLGYTAYFQDVRFVAQSGHGSDVSITYVGGGTAGSEIVTVTGSAISVKIQSGVSTSQQVCLALINSAAAWALVSATFILGTTAVTTQSQTYLALNPYYHFVVGGIRYTSVPPNTTGVSVQYANDGVAGHETVSVVGNAVTVHIASGNTTAKQVMTALGSAYATLAPILGSELLPNADSTVQTTLAQTFMAAGTPGTQFAVISRGARGTTAATHSSGSTVTAAIQLGDSVNQENSMDMALKVMLSGWAGSFVTGVSVSSIGIVPDPSPGSSTTQAITLGDGVDAIADYGLSAGDYITLVGSGYIDNNQVPFQIVRFQADAIGTPNRIIYVSGILTKELTTSATASFRSQYDCYPVDAGLKLTPSDVDVAGHQNIKNTFLGGLGNDLRFFITSQESSGKNWLESQVYFPVGAFSLTRRGQLSVGYNKPPLADASVVILNADNILSPDQVRPNRALNGRAFFNEIDLSYNPDDSGNFQTQTSFLDSDSYSTIKVLSVLPVQANGIYSGYNETNLQKRAQFLLQRYGKGATTLRLTVNWEAGSLIEAGDTVIVQDTSGTLQISNFNTGQRGLGTVLFEVIDRTINISSGNVTLNLLSGIGATVQDRFATISPSSVIAAGSTTTQLIIQDSFGAIYPGNESRKWEIYVGLPIVVHSFDGSVSGTTTLVSIDPINNYMLHVNTLGFTPQAGYIVDIPAYPNGVDPTVNQLYKAMHAFLDPTVTVVTGVDSYNLTVASGDIGKFVTGATIRVHSYDYATDSGEVTISNISVNQITTTTPMGFTPSAGQLIDLIGFPDSGFAYRWI